jgi:hypothetical protein
LASSCISGISVNGPDRCFVNDSAHRQPRFGLQRFQHREGATAKNALAQFFRDVFATSLKGLLDTGYIVVLGAIGK